MVCDCQTVYCFSLYDYSLRYCHIYDGLLSETRLYADNIDADVYGFTAEYDVYDGEYENISFDTVTDEDGEEDGIYEEYDENDGVPVPCMLIKLSADGSLQRMYSFTGMPQTMPTAMYSSQTGSFILFNYKTMQIEQFFCRSGKIRYLFESLTSENNMPPDAIHAHPSHPNEFYFMYPENCYLTSITTSRFSVLTKFPVDDINRLLSDSDHDRELIFKTSVVPVNGRFILKTDTNVYEWSSEEDTLILKYNNVYYNCCDLIGDPEHNSFFLVHMFNGISVFSGTPLKLVNSFCFSDRDYFIGCSCFEPDRRLLALNFSREDHEKVVLLEFFPYFITQHGDLGAAAAKGEEAMQSYWVTQGFFLEKERLNIPLPKCFRIEKSKRVPLSAPPVSLDFIFFRHKRAISKYRNDDARFSYVYISDDRSQAIFLKNSCYLFLVNDYAHCSYGEIIHGFEKKVGGYGGNACWEYPWHRRLRLQFSWYYC